MCAHDLLALGQKKLPAGEQWLPIRIVPSHNHNANTNLFAN